MASVQLTELSIDMITDILLRLPVKPLIRFQLLSKSFQNISTSQNFIKEHLKTSMESKAHINMILTDCCSNDYIKVDPVICVGNLSGKANSLHTPLPDKDDEDGCLGSSIKGCSCNGLVLLVTDRDKRIVLWNPFTRSYKVLPISKIGGPGFPLKEFLKHGLGYDPVTDDYKVVIILEKALIGSIDFSVYSLRSNSLEKKDFPYNGYSFSRESEQVFANGAFHWICYDIDNDYLENIVAFDITNETFSRFPMPSFHHGVSSHQELVEFEGSLCMRTAFKCNNLWYWELHVGEKHKNNITWCKLFKFSPNEYDRSMGWRNYWTLEPLMCSKDGNKVLCRYNLSKLIWYDLKSDDMFNLFANGDTFGTIICCESLISPSNDTAFDGEDYGSESNEEEVDSATDRKVELAIQDSDN